ncbi:PGF-CTERM sorting domain-containing protein [Halobacteria archaeon AArc-m2/3/4]|uniref:PGF-CTERM sorting domain-containing protein n=1 Tax=Natronoglomus mannanivorans TaxID=2979990 RepID=A0ABT2QE31_9EURY|nr:PGF-CTERM sorting domain-containing protein [Halobacteria archaeon AArc-m2/3/4]
MTLESDLTEDFDGPYHLEAEGDNDNERSATLWFDVQEVEFEFSPDTVEDAGEGSVADLVFEEDNREDTVTLDVTAELDGDALDEDTLAEIFDAEDGTDVVADEDDDENGVVTLSNADLGDEWAVDFDGQDLGEYNFTVDVTDTTAEYTTSITVEEESDALVSFDSSSYQGIIGDEVDIDMTIAEAENAYINMTHDGDVIGTIDITGVDEDDNVTLVVNTYLLDEDADEAVHAVDEDGDEIGTVTANFNRLGGEPLPVLEYELEVFEDDDREDETDAAFLTINDRSTDDISTHVAPQDLSITDDAQDFLNESTERDYVAQDDYLITEVEASGIYGYLLDDDGNWDADDKGLALEYELEGVGPFGQEQNFDITDLDDSDYQIHVDTDKSDKFYVIFNTDVVDDIGTDATFADGQTWNASFTVSAEDNKLLDDDGDDESVSTEFDVEERNVEFVGDVDDDDRLQISNSAESEINAETNIAPGTDADYRLRVGTDVYEQASSVSDDGTISASFDLSEYEAGEEVRDVRISAPDRFETTGVIVDAGEDTTDEKDDLELAVDAPSDVKVGEDAEFGVTLTNNKDEEVTTTVEFEFAGETEDAELTIGADSSASETFTVSELDAGDYDWSVSVDDYDLSDSGTLTVEADDKDEDTETPDESDDSDDSDDSTADDSDDSDDSDDDDGQPGFGVAVAIVALLAAAMLALRRQN